MTATMTSTKRPPPQQRHQPQLRPTRPRPFPRHRRMRRRINRQWLQDRQQRGQSHVSPGERYPLQDDDVTTPPLVAIPTQRPRRQRKRRVRRRLQRYCKTSPCRSPYPRRDDRCIIPIWAKAKGYYTADALTNDSTNAPANAGMNAPTTPTPAALIRLQSKTRAGEHVNAEGWSLHR